MNRRRLLTVGVATVVAAEWHTPIIKSVMLPAHAQTSVDLVSPEGDCGGDLQEPCNPLPFQECEPVDLNDPNQSQRHCSDCTEIANGYRNSLGANDGLAPEIRELYKRCDCDNYHGGNLCPTLQPLDD